MEIDITSSSTRHSHLRQGLMSTLIYSDHSLGTAPLYLYRRKAACGSGSNYCYLHFTSWSVIAATQESDHTFSAVSIMSIIVYTGKIIPMMATGAPMPDISERVRKKQPIGTPALPIADTTERRSHRSMVGMVSSIPPFCITKSEVIRMNAAQPFIFTVVQMGNTKRATLGLTPSNDLY